MLSNVKLDTSQEGSALLTWAFSEPSSIEGFEIEYKPPNGTWQLYNKLPSGSKEIKIPIQSNVVYSYKIKVVPKIEVAELSGESKVGSIVTKLTIDKTGIEIVSIPFGTDKIGVALMPKINSIGGEIKYTSDSWGDPFGHNLSATQKVYIPNKVGYPVVDMIALKEGKPIGGWAGRKETTSKSPSPEPIPIPVPTPSSVSTGKMWVGINAGYWGPSEPPDIKGCVDFVRLDSPGDISLWTNAGLQVINNISGPYTGNGIKGLDINKWAENAISWYKSNPKCVAIEILNEPGGDWFWGSGASGKENAEAYIRLLKAVKEKFVSIFGSNHVPLLASYDGGHAGSLAWGEMLWSIDSKVSEYINGITLHPYGGHGTNSAQGSRQSVETAHYKTGLPVYVTEVGWPTAVGQAPTGDSLQWTEEQQANNIKDFVIWARNLGYVKAVMIFGYRDQETNAQYGIEHHDGSHKLSYAALQSVAH